MFFSIQKLGGRKIQAIEKMNGIGCTIFKMKKKKIIGSMFNKTEFLRFNFQFSQLNKESNPIIIVIITKDGVRVKVGLPLKA